MLCLWLYCAENRPTGSLVGMSDEDIESAAEWDKALVKRYEPGRFIAAMLEVRFMDRVDGGYKLHDWEEHQPWVFGAPRRSEAARAKARKRWDKANAAATTGDLPLEPQTTDSTQGADAASMQGASKQHADSMQAASTLQCSVSVSDSVSNSKEGSPAAPATPPPKPAKPPSSSPVWESYAKAYKARYRTEPLRNATVNGILAKIVKQVGLEEAVHLAEFYLKHGNPFYAQRAHPVELLMQDLQKLHTEWKTGAGGRTAAPADPAARAEAQIVNRVNECWSEARAVLRLGLESSRHPDPLLEPAIAEIGGWSTLKRLPPRELEDKAVSFSRAFRRLAAESAR